VGEQVNTLARYGDWAKGGEVESAELIAPGEGAIVNQGLHKVAVYRDEGGSLHTLSAVCTHLGCVPLGIGDGAGSAAALATAAEIGLLTVALAGAHTGVRADHVLAVPSDDPRVVREGHVTTYHVLWELVHVFLEAGVA